MTIETWGKNRRALRNKPSKLDIIHEIGAVTKEKHLDIANLSIKDLKLILSAAKEHRHITGDVPNSRTKKPYIDCILEAVPGATNLDRLSIASLQNLARVFKEQ